MNKAKLSMFKSMQYVKLNEVVSKLLSKYPDRSDRIEVLSNMIKSKLSRLSSRTFYSYIRSIELASIEFSEFSELLPSSEDIRKMMEGG